MDSAYALDYEARLLGDALLEAIIAGLRRKGVERVKVNVVVEVVR